MYTYIYIYIYVYIIHYSVLWGRAGLRPAPAGVPHLFDGTIKALSYSKIVL